MQQSELRQGAFAPTIHDPIALATQSQLEEAKARKERLERFRSAAIPISLPVIEAIPEPVKPPAQPAPPVSDEAIREAHKIIEAPPPPEPDPIPRTPRIEDIQRAVARVFGVTRMDMISARRTAVLVKPRQIAMYLSKTMTLRSLPEIGRRFGGRDHTTVLHAIRKIGALVECDLHLAALIEDLTRRVLEAGSLPRVI